MSTPNNIARTEKEHIAFLTNKAIARKAAEKLESVLIVRGAALDFGFRDQLRDIILAAIEKAFNEGHEQGMDDEAMKWIRQKESRAVQPPQEMSYTSGGTRHLLGKPKISHVAQPQEWDDTKRLYHELLYQVQRKHPGESRHQTALRYIKEAERVNPNDVGSVAAHNASLKP